MNKTMSALVYEGPRQMAIQQVPVPDVQPDEVLIRVAFSGICGSELSGYLGQSSIRKPPLIMGHEFSGTIQAVGGTVNRPELKTGVSVTANPLLSCGQCLSCLSGKQHLCPNRKLLSAHLPGSNAEFVAIRADAVFVIPDEMPLSNAALAEPTACALHAAQLAAPLPHESGLVVGVGPIGLLTIQALMDRGLTRVYCIDLHPDRLAMAEKLGAIPTTFDEMASHPVDVVIEAVGIGVTRQGCVQAVRAGGRIVWVGLHEANTELPVNDIVRREITAVGSYAYTPVDFHHALNALSENRITLNEDWTQTAALENGTACFEHLLSGSAISKIWLTPTL